MTPEGWFGNDHPALRRCWHPVCRVADLDGDGPHPVRLLGSSWVLIRLGGRWSLLPDRCPHRLAPLHLGAVDDGVRGQVLRCAYHGWAFDGGGRCVEVPALGPGARVPTSADLVPAAAIEERFGLLWVALDEPLTPLPEVPEWDDPAFARVDIPVQDWCASAAQMADNFLDVGHFPFTHTGTIGDPADRVVAPYDVDRDGWCFTAGHRHRAQALLEGTEAAERVMRFTCTAPHHVRISLDYGEAGRLVLLFFHQPLDVGRTRLYCTELAENVADGRVPADEATAFQLAVADEDRRVLERLERKAVPLAPGVEVHTRADRITVELRRVLADLVAAVG